MEQINSPANPSFLSRYYSRQQNPQYLNETSNYQTKKIKRKVVDALKWMGIIGTSVALTAGVFKYAKIKPTTVSDLEWINGKAFLKECVDKPYTGNVVKKAADKANVVTVFKDGVVIRQHKNGKNGYIKNFKYKKNGKLATIKSKNLKIKYIYDIENKLVEKRVIKKVGKVAKEKNIYHFEYTPSKNLQAVSKNDKLMILNIYQKNSPSDNEVLTQVRHFDDKGWFKNKIDCNV